MKKLVLIFSLLLFPLFAIADDAFYSMDTDEYSKLFEEGFFNDEEIVENEYEIKKPSIKKKKIEEKNAIYLDNKPIELKVEKSSTVAPYKETYKGNSAKNEFYKSDKFTIFSNSSLETNKYMKNDFKSTMNASYKLNNAIDLNAGHEVWYVNSDATMGDRKIYINPKLNVTDNLYLDYKGKYNEINKNVEQEVGLNYKPKILKDSASFGVSAGTTTNEHNDTHSGKVKFTTDFYLF